MPFSYVFRGGAVRLSYSLVAFWLRVMLLFVCLAFGLFGNKFLIIQKKTKRLKSIV